MTAITVANADWTIVNGVKTALTGATISGSAVWTDVSMTTSQEQAEEAQYDHQSPVAIVRYLGTVEDSRPEDQRGLVVSMEIFLAVKKTTAADTDEALRVQEILRLMNAAKNAVEASPPSIAQATGDSNFYHQKIEWGVPRVDTRSLAPWATCILPVAIATNLDTGTSH